LKEFYAVYGGGHTQRQRAISVLSSTTTHHRGSELAGFPTEVIRLVSVYFAEMESTFSTGIYFSSICV
jgi:hypothetical protein